MHPQVLFEMALTHFSVKRSNLKCCLKLCIGCSMRSERIRIMEHKSCIQNGNIDAPLVEHFLKHQHSPKDLRSMVLYNYLPHGHDRVNVQQEEVQLIYRLVLYTLWIECCLFYCQYFCKLTRLGYNF